MNSAEFDDFARALSSPASSSKGDLAPNFRRVSVLGGGIEAQMLAALCLAEGAEVQLFSAYGRELAELRKAGGISLRGEGPIGTFQIDQDSIPSIRTTAALDDCVANAEVIFVTGPVHKQRTYAMALADHLVDGQVLVMLNARTFGTIEAAWLLRMGGCKAQVTLVDVPGLPFWATARGGSLHLSAAGPVAAATLPDKSGEVLKALQKFLPNLRPTHSALHSAFADATGAVELPVFLFAGLAFAAGGAVVPEGGVPLAQNDTFRNRIGADHTALIDALWQERRAVAAAYGVRDLPETDVIIAAVAGAASGAGSRPVPSRDAARLMCRCAVIGSLAPLVSAAQLAGKAVPSTQALITHASVILGGDLQTAGRRLETIGIDAATIESARSLMNKIVIKARHG